MQAEISNEFLHRHRDPVRASLRSPTIDKKGLFFSPAQLPISMMRAVSSGLISTVTGNIYHASRVARKHAFRHSTPMLARFSTPLSPHTISRVRFSQVLFVMAITTSPSVRETLACARVITRATLTFSHLSLQSTHLPSVDGLQAQLPERTKPGTVKPSYQIPVAEPFKHGHHDSHYNQLTSRLSDRSALTASTVLTPPLQISLLLSVNRSQPHRLSPSRSDLQARCAYHRRRRH